MTTWEVSVATKLYHTSFCCVSKLQPTTLLVAPIVVPEVNPLHVSVEEAVRDTAVEHSSFAGGGRGVVTQISNEAVAAFANVYTLT